MHVLRRSAVLLGVAIFIVALAASVGSRKRETAAPPGPVSWRGLVGGPRAAVPGGQRMIVVLNAPSVADRLARVRFATEAQERTWTSAAYAAQQQVLTTLAAQGTTIHPTFRYARVLDGFSAPLDGRAVALLEQLPEVVGVYPVRAAFPASLSESLLASKEFGAASGHRPAVELPGYDGRGVTIALLDTGVDQAHPFLRGKILPGLDIVGTHADATAQTNPLAPAQIERHGTEMAGLLVGSDGPGGLHGVAPGATILPIRVAGWQPAADGSELVYGRTDQLIAGLERAVDPNGDGDSHDAVRVALVGEAEPYAAFTDSPEARAVQGALDLNTLVVAPAGNDGAAGPSFGSIAGPAGGGGALAVGATDSRPSLPQARVVLRRGLDVILDQRLPLLGAALPRHSLTLGVVSPAENSSVGSASGPVLYGPGRRSLVAGRAVVLPAGASPEARALAASRAGAAAVLLYGDGLPAGALRLSEDETAPVFAVPTAAAVELLAATRAGTDVGVAIGVAGSGGNPGAGRVAGFSSQGLAFDSTVKPDLVAPGIALATAEPGAATDVSPHYGTVSGTSGAAATVAGAAALLAQLRPALDGPSLESLLVGYAAPGSAPGPSSGTGTLRLGASAVGEVAAQPATLGLGLWGGPGWHATRSIVVRNMSTRRLQLSISAVAGGDSEALHFTVSPDRLVLAAGRASRVQVRVTAPVAPRASLVTGSIQVAASGSETLHVPWALVFKTPSPSLLAHVTLSKTAFKPSDSAPALLSVQAGALVRAGILQIKPVARLDVLLYTAAGGFVGPLARLRDLLPGSYSFGITGRGPSSAPLQPGRYELRLAAWPTLPAGGRPSRAQVSFRIE